MSTDAKIAALASFLVVFCLACLFLGAAWEKALRHDCRLAAMATKLYDSAQIAQICGK